jgi:lipopolysaccharide/colanic/teichoic acid biosynthesis glycosyltransferase
VDLLLVVLASPVCIPLMVAVAAAIRLGMGSPVLFRQRRAGLNGQPFTILKFRTMEPETSGRWDPGTDAMRLTTLGRWLRRWSLDELPQLLNILRGDMGWVGPRPLPVSYLSRYSVSQLRRHAVRPGLTGWAQVNGRNAVDWPERLAMDVWYVDHVSLALDLRILVLTVHCALSGQGLSGEGAATMREFQGEH